MKLVLGSVILASGILLSSLSGFAASGGWQSDGQGTRYWHVTPRPGQCNISQAKTGRFGPASIVARLYSRMTMSSCLEV